MAIDSGTLWTIGHSNRPWDAFEGLLREAGIAVLADVRRFAGSRRNPQFSRDAMPQALAEALLAQTGDDPLLPGNRVDDFDLNVTLAQFGDLVEELAAADA